MKNYTRVPMLVVMAALLLASSAMAYPFTEVVGTVNPYSAVIVDNSDGTSSITGLEYVFTVTGDGGTGAKMNFLSLEFENDVFASVGPAYGYDPGDWTTSVTNSSGSLYTLSAAGTPVAAGDSLSFMIDVVIYNKTLADATWWDEGQVWGQSWFSTDTLRGGDGGSTNPVPEPATLLLLGTGIVGLVGAGRKKLLKK